jgi:hypothetical protein
MSWFVVQGHELNPFTGRPDNTLPGPGYGGGRPDNSLPWAPARPDGGLPWGPGRPDNTLPVPPVLPGQDLPWAPARPDNTLPGGGHASGQPIVPGATPYGTAVATPPPEKVDPTKGGWLLVSVPGHGLVWAWGQPPVTKPGGGATGSTGAAPKM